MVFSCYLIIFNQLFERFYMIKNTKPKFDIFISYSHSDELFVRTALIPRLKRNKLKFIWDDNFVIGWPLNKNIEYAITNSRFTICVISNAWINSEWAEYEYLLVQKSDPSGRNGKILPLKIDECEVPKKLSVLFYADFTNPREYAKEFKKLLKQIQFN